MTTRASYLKNYPTWRYSFALMGGAGYIAERHYKAIRAIGGNIIAICDPSDSVGVIDKYFPECDYFKSPEQFERFLCQASMGIQNNIDYLVICTPNYMHDTHIRMGLSYGMDVICEKPLVINPRTLVPIKKFENGNHVYSVLQLRYSEKLIGIKHELENMDNTEVTITYIAPRGSWYDYSWKGDEIKSGGIAMNIGIHLFDLMIWIFGSNYVIKEVKKINHGIKGKITFGNNTVNFLLSTHGEQNKKIIYNHKIYDFSENFTELHEEVYSAIVAGSGIGIDSCMDSLKLVQDIRTQIN